jgi:hypothetical protein
MTDSASIAASVVSSSLTNIVLFGMFIIFMIMFGSVVGIVMWKHYFHTPSIMLKSIKNFKSLETDKTFPTLFSHRLPILFPFTHQASQTVHYDNNNNNNNDCGLKLKQLVKQLQKQITSNLARIQALEKAEQDKAHKEKVAIEIGEIDLMLKQELPVLSFEKELTNDAIDYLYKKFLNLDRIENKDKYGHTIKWSFKIREPNVSN